MKLQKIDDMQAIIDVMPYPVFVKDRSHRMVLLNDAACAFFGHSREALLTHSDELFPPEQVRVFHDADERVFTSGEDHENEELVTDSAGDVRTVITRKRRVRLYGKDYLVASCADVTPYREADREQYFDLSLDLLCIATTSGYFRHVNPAFREALGWSNDELLSRPFLTLVHPDDHDSTLRQLQLLAAGRKTEHFENRYRCKDGNYRWLAWKVVQGRDGLLYGAARDVTETRATHDMLAQAKLAAEAASRAKSAFLATMSHEIRTPMNGVLGMLEVLERSEMSRDQRDMTRTVRESAGALLAIIDDILDFSKIEAGRLELERQPVSLVDVVEGLSSTLVPLANQKNVRLHTFVSPQLPAAVLSDDTRLRQLLYNLAGNAIKFSGGRPGLAGRVNVEVVVAQQSPLRVAFRVGDNGIGMSPETLANLFAPFSQAEVSTTRRFGGTGLGLAICQRLAGMMEGEISVSSQPGAGSSFLVELPFVTADAPEPEPAYDLSGLACVIVESAAFDATYLRLYIEHAGGTVHVIPPDAALTALPPGTGPVIVVHDGDRNAVCGFFAAPPSRPVTELVLVPGHRGTPRSDGPSRVALGADGLRRQGLLHGIAMAAGRRPLQRADHQPPVAGTMVPQQPAITDARAQGRLILVAEDDDINQKVILRQLGLLGYAAEVACNGHEALRLWQEQEYALLLTDLHMPDMDGYQLASAIRRAETGGHRIPIIALTANALVGESGRAKAAGMDGYLTKPLRLEALRAELDRWMRDVDHASAGSASPAAVAECARPAHAAVDFSVLSALIGDDEQGIRELLADYLDSLRQLAGQLRHHARDGMAREVGGLAHRLKSSSRSVGAMALGDLCNELENAGRAEDHDAIRHWLAELERTLPGVEAVIGQRLASDP